MNARRFAPALALLAACASPSEVEPDPNAAILFLVQETKPESVMEALYEGRVVTDDEGCIRLDFDVRHTVVWPFGFRLVERGDERIVRHEDGHDVGTLGGDFKLGGGEVPDLPERGVLPPVLRSAALERCPGRFWLVGEVPR